MMLRKSLLVSVPRCGRPVRLGFFYQESTHHRVPCLRVGRIDQSRDDAVQQIVRRDFFDEARRIQRHRRQALAVRIVAPGNLFESACRRGVHAAPLADR
ncbi:MAG: hypothetical protein QGG50_03555, partial [Methanopyri archaeon]|nr:hypothetical protein [Methanopyri archaeon]